MDTRVWGIVADSFAKLLISGITVATPLTLISFAPDLILAVVVAPVCVAKVPVASQTAWFYIWVFRGMPLLVQLLAIFFGLPSVSITIPALPSAVIAFSPNVGAYAAETLYGVILAMPRGQLKADLATNMPHVTIMHRIILSRASHSVFPALFNPFIALVKDTSFVANIIVVEMSMTVQCIMTIHYEPLVLYTEVGLIYLLSYALLGWLQNYCEKKLNRHS